MCANVCVWCKYIHLCLLGAKGQWLSTLLWGSLDGITICYFSYPSLPAKPLVIFCFYRHPALVSQTCATVPNSYMGAGDPNISLQLMQEVLYHCSGFFFSLAMTNNLIKSHFGGGGAIQKSLWCRYSFRCCFLSALPGLAGFQVKFTVHQQEKSRQELEGKPVCSSKPLIKEPTAHPKKQGQNQGECGPLAGRRVYA